MLAYHGNRAWGTYTSMCSVNSGVLCMQTTRGGLRNLSAQQSNHLDKRNGCEQSTPLLDDIATQDAYTVALHHHPLLRPSAAARQQ